jgi:hypothetical protein
VTVPGAESLLADLQLLDVPPQAVDHERGAIWMRSAISDAASGTRTETQLSFIVLRDTKKASPVPLARLWILRFAGDRASSGPSVS